MAVETEIDGDILAQQAYAEMDGKEPEKKPDEKPAEPVEKQPDEPTAEPSKEQEPSEEDKAAKEQAEAEDKRILEAKDEELDETQKARKVELTAKAAEAEKAKTPERPEEEIVRDHALKHNLTMDEAKEDIDKTKAIVEKYKGDPAELARALRSTQSGYDQLKAKEAKPQVIIQKDPTAEIKEYAEKNREKIIEAFRRKFPIKGAVMEDDAILEDAVAQAERDYEVWARGEGEKVTREATGRREQLLASVPEGDKRFIPDIKALLSRTPDNQVVHESFDIKDLIYHARGAYYTPDRVKTLEDAAFKRGKEDPKIIGVKSPSSGGPAPKAPSGASSGLNGDQKSRALEMFVAEDGYSEADAYKAFADTFKEELKKDKNYL